MSPPTIPARMLSPAIPALMNPFAPPPPRRCVLYGCNTYTPSGGDSTSSDDNIAGHRPVRPPFVVSRLRSDFETANELLALSAPRTQLECCQAARSHHCRGRHERAPRPVGGHDGQTSVHRLQSFAAAQLRAPETPLRGVCDTGYRGVPSRARPARNL